MVGSYEIRIATTNDAVAIANIYEEILKKQDAGEASIGWVRGVYPTYDSAMAAIGRGEMYALIYNEEIVAAAIINHTQVDVYELAKWKGVPESEDDVAVLHTLVVSPRMSGRGFGSAFVGFYEEKAREWGSRNLRMDTNVINVGARALYKRLGYEEVGMVPCVFNGIPGVQLVCLEKLL